METAGNTTGKHRFNAVIGAVVLGVGTLYLSTNLLTPFFSDLFVLTLELPKADSITWGRTAALVIPTASASAEFIQFERRKLNWLFAFLAVLVVATRLDATHKEELQAQAAARAQAHATYNEELNTWKEQRTFFFEKSPRAQTCALAASASASAHVRKRRDTLQNQKAFRCAELGEDFRSTYPRPEPPKAHNAQPLSVWGFIISMAKYLGPGGLEAIFAEISALLGYCWARYVTWCFNQHAELPLLKRALQTTEEERAAQAALVQTQTQALDALKKELETLSQQLPPPAEPELIEEEDENEATSLPLLASNVLAFAPRHTSLREAELEAMGSHPDGLEALRNLDTTKGTWRGLPIFGTKPRRVSTIRIRWPYLLPEGRQKSLFIGSPEAVRYAEKQRGDQEGPPSHLS